MSEFERAQAKIQELEQKAAAAEQTVREERLAREYPLAYQFLKDTSNLDEVGRAAALENFVPRGQAAFATGIIASQRAEQDLIARRLETSRFDMAGSSVKTSQWFFDVTSGKTEVDNGPSASITGATAGFIRDIGFDSYAGFSFSIGKSKGDNISTTANSNGYRIGAFGGTMTDKRTLAIDVGASLASFSGDVTRNSVFGGNVGQRLQKFQNVG